MNDDHNITMIMTTTMIIKIMTTMTSTRIMMTTMIIKIMMIMTTTMIIKIMTTMMPSSTRIMINMMFTTAIITARWQIREEEFQRCRPCG